MMRPSLFALTLLAAASPVLSIAAQDSGSGITAVVLAPSMMSWSFGKPIQSDSFEVEGVSHLSVPFSVRMTFGRTTLDAGGGYTSGTVRLEDGRTFDLSGLTDVRVRGVTQLIQDRILLTVGLNLPTGASELSGSQVDALGVLGGSALGLPSLALGNGFGMTAGLVYAFRRGSWGVAVGSSYETRSQYTPLEVQISGARAPADFDPGNASRVSLALDRLVGQGRLSILVAGDFYGENRLQLKPEGGDPQDSRYTPGPQFAGALSLDLGVSGFRSFRITIADRYRDRFTGADGLKAEGSNGNVFEAALEAVRGRARGVGFYVRADSRFDSGLEVDNTIATAAMSTVGVSLGLSVVSGSMSVLPFVRAQAGRLDAGTSSASATGFGAGITVITRQ